MSPTVVFVHAPDPTLRIGGGERYVCAHARAARRAGFEVHLFCVAGRSGVEQTDLGTVHRLRSPIRPFRNLMAPLHAPFLARGLRRFLAGRTGPHILHAFTSSAGAAVQAASSTGTRGARCAVVTTMWDCLYEESVAKLAGVDPSQGLRGRINPAIEVAWNRLVMRRYEARNCQRCQAVYVNYESVRRLLVSQYGVDTGRIHQVPYTSETTFLPPADLPMPEAVAQLRSAGVPLIVVMSRHVPRKGLVFLFQALAQLQAEGHGFRACFVGGGYLLEHHRRLVRDLGLREVVRVVGRVPETYEYVRHADLFVLPSLEEGSGSMSMIEAMQAGVPIIATRIDGIPEDVTDGDDALLVPPGDAGALASAIRRVLQDPALRQRLGSRAHETYRARFSAASLVHGLAEAYDRLQFPG